MQVNRQGSFQYASTSWFARALGLLQASGVEGVAVDVWVSVCSSGQNAGVLELSNRFASTCCMLCVPKDCNPEKNTLQPKTWLCTYKHSVKGAPRCAHMHA